MRAGGCVGWWEWCALIEEESSDSSSKYNMGVLDWGVGVAKNSHLFITKKFGRTIPSQNLPGQLL